MKFIITEAMVYDSGKLSRLDVAVDGERVEFLTPDVSDYTDTAVFSFPNHTIFPGFVDVHTHLREPGFSYKETIATGTRAAARGGFTTICSMPNLDPVPDSLENLRQQQKIIARDAVVNVLPYASITVGQAGMALADMESLAPHVVGFTDDGRGVQSEAVMRAAMIEAARLGKLIVAHCEDNSLLHGGYIHDGEYALAHGHRAISSESEWRQLERDLRLVRETGCAYHVCHISAKESVELIRAAKAEGLDVTCEVTPHHLLLRDSDLREDGNFKMNPPLRSAEDKAALISGCLDGTIDMIATDHAPHSAEEKGRGLEGSLFGIVALETCYPLLYTHLVKTDIMSLERLVEMMTTAPAQRFKITQSSADFSIWDLTTEYAIDPAELISLGKSMPFEGWKVSGKCAMTVVGGVIKYQEVYKA